MVVAGGGAQLHFPHGGTDLNVDGIEELGRGADSFGMGRLRFTGKNLREKIAEFHKKGMYIS